MRLILSNIVYVLGGKMSTNASMEFMAKIPLELIEVLEELKKGK
jgi:hypothetical protein